MFWKYQLTIYCKKLVLLLLVLYAVTCQVITVKNYHFTWCSVVKNVIFNTCFSSTICYVGIFYFEDFFNCHLELFGENCMKILTTGQIFLLSYKWSGFRNNQVNLNELFFLEMQVQIKLEIPWNFETRSFKLTRFYNNGLIQIHVLQNKVQANGIIYALLINDQWKNKINDKYLSRSIYRLHVPHKLSQMKLPVLFLRILLSAPVVLLATCMALSSWLA
jgi:hypothetical protein